MPKANKNLEPKNASESDIAGIYALSVNNDRSFQRK
jgi:hypothetical protein